MDDFKIRLMEESQELNKKIGKLIDFLGNPIGPEITETQNTLLELQLKHMRHYASCLNLRIDDLNNK